MVLEVFEDDFVLEGLGGGGEESSDELYRALPTSLPVSSVK